MHRALLIPEIVTGIIEAGNSSPGFLYTCLFTSKVFSLEASRILWYRCGASEYPEAYGHATPDIRHLAQIVIHDAGRAQLYANLVHVLSFSKEEPEESEEPEYASDLSEDEDEDDAHLYEIRWHKELATLQFPLLEEFTLYETSNKMESNTGDMIAHYAQPYIRSIKAYRGNGLSESLFGSLTHSCPRLTSLILNNITASKGFEHALVRFLKKADALTWLDIRTGVYDSWSYEAFKAIARLPNLTHTTIPDIQDEWVDSVCSTDCSSSEPKFPSLEDLETGMSNHGLECLAHKVPELQVLDLGLHNFPSSHQILMSASGFSHLTSLTIDYGERSRVSGNELLHLVRNCPLLERLSIGEVKDATVYPETSGRPPTGLDINDNIIDEMAQVLGARIVHLRVFLDRSDLLTWRSILSLAQYCENIMDLSISCNFNWQEVMSNTPEHTFPVLEGLHLKFDPALRESQHVVDINEEAMQIYAQRMLVLAPGLSHFWIEDGNKNDAEWAWAAQCIFYNKCSAARELEG